MKARADLLKDGALTYFTNHHQSNLEQIILNSSCFSIKNIRYSTLCNPAHLPLIKDKRYSINFLIGEDYQQLSKNEDLIRGDRRKELAISLLSENQQLRLESALQMYFLVPTFSFSIEPAKWTYFSTIINGAYPDLAIHAMQEQKVKMQLGTSLDQQLSMGLNMILSQRKYVHEQVNLFEAIADSTPYFQVKEEQLLIVEPGLHYEFKTHNDSTIETSMDLAITNTGWRKGDTLSESHRPGYLIGFNASPKPEYGNLDLSLNYFTDLSELDWRSLHFAMAYTFDFYSILMDLSKNHYAIGTVSNYYLFKTGLMFRRKILETTTGTSLNDDGVFLEISTGI